jgi:hypothetical protein
MRARAGLTSTLLQLGDVAGALVHYRDMLKLNPNDNRELKRWLLHQGGPDEATYYVMECGAAWHRTPSAVTWLTKFAATLAPKRRTRAVH